MKSTTCAMARAEERVPMLRVREVEVEVEDSALVDVESEVDMGSGGEVIEGLLELVGERSAIVLGAVSEGRYACRR